MCLSEYNIIVVYLQFSTICMYLYNLSREWREKIDIVEDLETDTLEFTERKTFIFSSELSAPLTGNEELTLMHPLLTVGIMLVILKQRIKHFYRIGDSTNSERGPGTNAITHIESSEFNIPQTTDHILDRQSYGHDVQWHSG